MTCYFSAPGSQILSGKELVESVQEESVEEEDEVEVGTGPFKSNPKQKGGPKVLSPVNFDSK